MMELRKKLVGLMKKHKELEADRESCRSELQMLKVSF